MSDAALSPLHAVAPAEPGRLRRFFRRWPPLVLLSIAWLTE